MWNVELRSRLSHNTLGMLDNLLANQAYRSTQLLAIRAGALRY
jgi:hypothetical protein